MSSKPAPEKAENSHNSRLQKIEELDPEGRRFQAIFDTSAVAIGMMSLDRKLLEANPAFCRLFGMSRDELIGQPPAVVTYPDDYEQSTRQFLDLLAGKQDTFWGERRYQRKNGQIFWADVTMSLLRGPDGKPLFIVGMLVDIDERKRAMQALHESVERFRATFDSTVVGICLIGLDGRIQRANAAICKMYGYTEEELLQRHDFENVFPEDRTIRQDHYDEMLSGERDSFQLERRYIRKDGKVFWARISFAPVRDTAGGIRYLVEMIEDIDEQRRIMEELQGSEARFRAMFDNVSVGMSLMSLDRHALAVNQAVCRICGYSEDELIGINPVTLAYPDDREIGMQDFQQMMEGKRDGMQMEKRYVRKDGKIFWGRITYSMVRDANANPLYLVGSMEDITDQRMANEKLAAQEAEYRNTLEQRVEERTRELREANLRLVGEIEQRQHAEDALASKAAEEAILAERNRLARDLHDAVTQTLFSASLIAEVLPEIWDMDQDEARRSTEELRQLTRGALAEMRTLLLELRPAALTQARLPDLLKQLSEAVIGRARLPVEVQVQGDYDLPPAVKVAFYRIAQESLNNIVKYARATRVVMSIELDCCNVQMRIHDNGVGFDPASIKPTSLGMRIMRERAQAIWAHINIESAPGQGTTVSLDWDESGTIPNSPIPIRGEK